MYIAVIADNIANRKHMERLLDRTSDAIMATTGNLYIESYGDPESMWPSIKRYDLFFVDITQDDALKEAVVNRLMELALNSQTVICQAQDEAMSPWPTEHGFLSMQHPLSMRLNVTHPTKWIGVSGMKMAVSSCPTGTPPPMLSIRPPRNLWKIKQHF